MVSAAATARAGQGAARASRVAAAMVALLTGLAVLYLVFSIYVAGKPLWALGVLILAGTGIYIYVSRVNHAYRYLYPGLAAMAVFVAFPLFYTASIGFTNYSSAHLLSEQRARDYLLNQASPVESTLADTAIFVDADRYRIVVTPRDGGSPWVSAPIDLTARTSLTASLVPLQEAGFTPTNPLDLRRVIALRAGLANVTLKRPDGVVLSYSGLSEFAQMTALWKNGEGDALVSGETGKIYLPNRDTGFFEHGVGVTADRLSPGFTVGVGLANYLRMVADPDFRGPFFKIFLWTVAFSSLTVLLTVVVGMPLAVLLNWEALRFRNVYRTLVFLPYAVPAFISILVFKGLFNQNFGEINHILNGVFGVRPAWFADPWLAKIMILIVNTWLGYPYIMILCSGLIKAIPADLYEASAIAGASPLVNFFKITAPLIAKPLTPLLITVFAFNFNNFVVIALLTDGRPDFLNTKVPAGQTDILVSYTYRLAFQDTGQNFGLAAAVSTVIFFMVAALSMANMKLAQGNREKGK